MGGQSSWEKWYWKWIMEGRDTISFGRGPGCACRKKTMLPWVIETDVFHSPYFFPRWLIFPSYSFVELWQAWFAAVLFVAATTPHEVFSDFENFLGNLSLEAQQRQINGNSCSLRRHNVRGAIHLRLWYLTLRARRHFKIKFYSSLRTHIFRNASLELNLAARSSEEVKKKITSMSK